MKKYENSVSGPARLGGSVKSANVPSEAAVAYLVSRIRSLEIRLSDATEKIAQSLDAFGGMMPEPAGGAVASARPNVDGSLGEMHFLLDEAFGSLDRLEVVAERAKGLLG